jgi:outer membrane protein OmpA-like peptidoglycan-associated protein
MLFAVCVLSALRAEAQNRFDVELFDPAPAVEGSVLTVHGAHTLAPGAFTLSGLASYGRKPLTLESENSGRTLGELAGSVSTYSLMGAVGLWKHADIGLALPLHRVSAGSNYDNPPPVLAASLMQETKTSFGDIRVVPRVSLLRPDSRLGLALLLPMSLPTGKREHYAGESFRIEPRVALDYKFQRGALLAFNAGYLVREEAQVLGEEIDDMVRLGAGADVPVALGLSVLAEVNTQLNVLGADLHKANAPTEGTVGLRFRRAGFLAQLGGGPGIVRGLGAPRYRFFASLSWSYLPAGDADGDRLADNVDACPREAEDRDGFEDADGCPEWDNDRDGITDDKDRCPNAAEDMDGFGDEDGCPEADFDGDGTLDVSDQCPADPEDQDNYEDKDGCPEPDNDQDGVLDAADTCPRMAEDPDGFEDEDGCPDSDNDGDGVLDGQDRCPLQPGPATSAGCPAEQKVVLSGDQIELREQVFFAHNRATIAPRSGALLDAIAGVLEAHPELLRVTVQGHTDSTGSSAKNRTLSTQRAKAVVSALIKRGIAPTRLTAEGYGSDRPISGNDTEEGRALNRRVELHLEQRSAP